MPPGDNTILLTNARIIFRNFAGEEKQYNAKGDRNFHVILDEETGQKMIQDNWNVKRLKSRNEDEPGDLALKVKISYKGRSKPRIVMITKSKNRRNVLDEDMLELMDYAEFETIDLILRPYDWDVNGKQGRSAYLKTIFATIYEDELELKYSYLEDGDQQIALTIGDDPNVVDGEVLDEYEDDERPALPRGRS